MSDETLRALRVLAEALRKEADAVESMAAKTAGWTVREQSSFKIRAQALRDVAQCVDDAIGPGGSDDA